MENKREISEIVRSLKEALLDVKNKECWEQITELMSQIKIEEKENASSN